MIWLVGSFLYAAVAAVACRVIAGHLAWRMFGVEQAQYPNKALKAPTGEQWFGAWMTALCLAVVWPFVAVTLLVPWRMGAEREAALAERERRIAKAEKELGL